MRLSQQLPESTKELSVKEDQGSDISVRRNPVEYLWEVFKG